MYHTHLIRHGNWLLSYFLARYQPTPSCKQGNSWMTFVRFSHGIPKSHQQVVLKWQPMNTRNTTNISNKSLPCMGNYINTIYYVAPTINSQDLHGRKVENC